MSNGEAIVFDLDGTLIDSVPAVTAAINQVLDEDGIAPLSTDQVKSSVGEGANAMLRMLLQMRELEATDAAVEQFRRRYLDVYLADPADNTVVYPGVVAVLDQFLTDGVLMGICTNKPGVSTRAVLDALGFSKYFGAIVSADDTEFRKPDGRHVLQTLQQMQADVKTAIMVGDSETDAAAGIGAGLPTVVVRYGYCHAPHDSLEVTALIDRFDELPDVCGQIFRKTRTQ